MFYAHIFSENQFRLLFLLEQPTEHVIFAGHLLSPFAPRSARFIF